MQKVVVNLVILLCIETVCICYTAYQDISTVYHIECRQLLGYALFFKEASSRNLVNPWFLHTK
jgi:hypothetical protein